MTRAIKTIIYFLAFMLALAGCKAPKLTEQSIEPMPHRYPGVADSMMSATLNWREYFSDPVLEGLIDTALQNNPDMKMALQRIEMARADVRYSKGLLLPTVDGVVWAGQERTSEYSVNWAGNEGGTYASGDPLRPTYADLYLGFQSTWEADIWGKLKNKKKAAYARYLASEEGKNWVVTNLVSEVANTYFELRALDSELQIIRENLSLQESALAIVRIQKEAGAANELAVKQFEAQLLNFQSMEKETKQAIVENENRINYLLGRYFVEIPRSEELFEQDITERIGVGLPSALLRNRPDIRQAEYDLLASKADVKAARAAFFPTLSINGGVGYNAFNTRYLLFTPESFAYTLFGGVVAPLVNRSAIKADFNRSRAAEMEALYAYQQTILNGYFEVSNEMANLQTLEEMHDLKRREAEVQSQSVAASTELFKMGHATYLEVLITQQNALQTNLELVDTRKRQYLALANIYKALGGGWQ